MNSDNLIPKSLFNSRLLIWKSLTLKDIVFILFCLIIAACLSFPFAHINILYRILIFIFISIIFLLNLIKITQRDLRMYQYFWLFFLFLINKKKYLSTVKKYRNNLEFLNFDDEAIQIKNKQIRTKCYMSAIQINGINFNALNYDEQDLKRKLLAIIIKNIESEFCLIKIDEKIDFNKQAKYLQILANNLKNSSFIKSKEQENNYLFQMQYLYEWYINNTNNAEYMYKKWYLIYYGKNKEELNQNKKHIMNEFSRLFYTKALPSIKLINILKNIFNPISDDIRKEDIKNKDLNKIIFEDNFDDINFHFDSIITTKHKQKSYYSINTLSNLPNEASYNWLNNLSENNSTIIINTRQITREEAKQCLQKSINNYTFMWLNKNEYKEAVNKEELASNLEVLNNIKDDIAHNTEKLRNYNINFLNYGYDKDSLGQNIIALNEAVKNENMNLNNLSMVQKDVFHSIFPKYKTALYKYGIQLPSLTFASSFPFIDSLFIDEKGLFLGNNDLNNPIVLDLWNRENRLNSNMVVLGTSGGGKSSFIKKLINNQVIFDSYVYIIDPERDYTYLVKYYHGQIIDMANGKLSRINPLQIFLNEKLEDDNLQIINNTASLIAEHLKMLETFFTTLMMDTTGKNCKLDNLSLFYLMKEIKKLYQNWKLFDKNLYILNTNDYPTFDDLVQSLKKSNTKLTDKEDRKIYSFLIDIISDYFCNNGIYAELYNGKSNLKIGDSQLVCFDVKNLLATKHAPSKNAQLLLMTAYIENEINKNAYNNQINKKHALLIVDEAHLFFDHQNTHVLEFLSQTSKRIRKRNGGLILATQNPSDFVATKEIQSFTKAILQNAQYTFAFSSKPQDVKAIADIYKIAGDELTENEKLWISMGIKGRCLFINGYRDRQMLDVYIANYEWLAIGNEIDQKYNNKLMNEEIKNKLDNKWFNNKISN